MPQVLVLKRQANKKKIPVSRKGEEQTIMTMRKLWKDLLFDESNEDTLIDSIDDESGLRKAVLPISETIPDESFFVKVKT